MFLRQKATSWSTILLRDEILHAGIRPVRTPLKSACSHPEGAGDSDGATVVLAPEGAEPDRMVSC